MSIGLTTVRQDAVLMAEHAVRFAVERLEDPGLEPRRTETAARPAAPRRGHEGAKKTTPPDGAGGVVPVAVPMAQAGRIALWIADSPA